MNNNSALAKTDYFDKEQLAVIETQFFPSGATKAEQQYCFSVAKELGLNPITKEIYFVPRRSKVGDKWINKVEPMVGRDGFLSIAHKSGQLAGIETKCSIKDVPLIESGKWVPKPQLVAECIVWRKDSHKPFTAQVAYTEYVQKNNDGQPTKFWAEKPETMLKKVAESQALRKAFNIHGVYCPEEIGDGFETITGEIITPAIEADYTRAETKTHLTIVSPQLQEQQPPSEKEPPQPPQTPLPSDDEDSWPVGSPPDANSSPTEVSIVNTIIRLLEGKSIRHEIDRQAGIISANDYNNKDLLKANGFRWSADNKSWIYRFEPDPF